MNLTDIEAAAARLKGVTLHTPLVYSHSLSRMSGREVYLKLENLQTTGSFKLRGAVNRIALLKERGEGRGVAAASAGNHAQGVAFAAARLDIPALIVMPLNASISKQLATRSYGGEIVLYGRDLGEALARARELAPADYIFIHPYDDPEVMAGQGTIGLEILRDLPQVDSVVVPVGGGGLAAGVALALKEHKPGSKVFGVQALRVPSLAAALKEGRPTPVAAPATLADGIAVPQVGAHPFPLLRKYLSGVVLVEEAEIAQALFILLEKKKILAEGAAAAAAAAFLGPLKGEDLGRRVVLLISGGNIDIPLLERIVPRALQENRRLLTLRVGLPDRPGSLGKLAALLGAQGANILHLFHDRLARELPLDYTRVEMNLETRGPEHSEAVLAALTAAGYEVDEKS
jgi:threonine dehydratase